MKHRWSIGAGVVAFVLFGAAFGGICAAEPPHSGDPVLDRAIAQANSEWATAMKTGDAAVIARPYLDDAVFVGVDGSSFRGRAAIEELYRERFRKNGLAAGTRIEPRRVTLDGDLAYETGYGEVTYRKDGKPATSGGPYLTVWRKQADGEWKILRNVVLP